FLELFSVIDIESKQDELQKLKEQLTSKNSELANLYKQIESKNKEVSGKSETSYLNIIQALKDELLASGKFKDQTELLLFLSDRYTGYTGLTESNLRDKFAKANNIK
ncbi:TPA: SlyX protein, partial [Pasteurella multocida]|nr:SlyX protein [Pasteurella multocida]